MTGYMAKIMSRAQLGGTNHINYQYGASNRYTPTFASYQPLFQYGGYGQQSTVVTHENTKTYNGHGLFGKVFGGLWDFAKAAIGAATGQQIGGTKDTITTTGGYYPTGCFGSYGSFGPNMNISGFGIGNWGSALGGLVNTLSATGNAQQATASQKAETQKPVPTPTSQAESTTGEQKTSQPTNNQT